MILCEQNNLGQFWIDSLVHDKAALDMVIQKMGADRVAMGSDYPFPLGELEPAQLIRSAGYSTAIQQQLLSGAALQWLDLDRGDFH